MGRMGRRIAAVAGGAAIVTMVTMSDAQVPEPTYAAATLVVDDDGQATAGSCNHVAATPYTTSKDPPTASAQRSPTAATMRGATSDPRIMAAELIADWSPNTRARSSPFTRRCRNVIETTS